MIPRSENEHEWLTWPEEDAVTKVLVGGPVEMLWQGDREESEREKEQTAFLNVGHRGRPKKEPVSEG